VSERILRLPFYTDMTQSEQDQVIEALSRFPFLETVARIRSAVA
jgi:dTDP-4-amino-4,6-dideoxygalactose transaminase